MLIMNIFIFSVSLLLAFHHVHLHHLCSILHFEQSWLESWKVGELNWGSEGIGSVQLTCNIYLGKSDVLVWKKRCGCSYINLHPVLCAVCVPTYFLSAKRILPWTDAVLLLLLEHEWPSSHLHCRCDSAASAAFAPASCSHSLSCAAGPVTWQAAGLGSRWSWKITP